MTLKFLIVLFFTLSNIISLLQIYNEDLLDLLCLPSQRQPLSIREELNGEIRVRNFYIQCTVYYYHMLEECCHLTISKLIFFFL